MSASNLSWSKTVNTHLYDSRQWFNLYVIVDTPCSEACPLITDDGGHATLDCR